MDPLASDEALDAANTSSLIGQILILVALPPTPRFGGIPQEKWSVERVKRQK
jgi:hypothetical protein